MAGGIRQICLRQFSIDDDCHQETRAQRVGLHQQPSPCCEPLDGTVKRTAEVVQIYSAGPTTLDGAFTILKEILIGRSQIDELYEVRQSRRPAAPPLPPCRPTPRRGVASPRRAARRRRMSSCRPAARSTVAASRPAAAARYRALATARAAGRAARSPSAAFAAGSACRERARARARGERVGARRGETRPRKTSARAVVLLRRALTSLR